MMYKILIKCRVLIILGLLIACVVLLMSCEQKTQPTKTTKTAESRIANVDVNQIPITTPLEICKDFDANPIVAGEKYYNKYFRVIGTIKQIRNKEIILREKVRSLSDRYNYNVLFDAISNGIAAGDPLLASDMLTRTIEQEAFRESCEFSLHFKNNKLLMNLRKDENIIAIGIIRKGFLSDAQMQCSDIKNLAYYEETIKKQAEARQKQKEILPMQAETKEYSSFMEEYYNDAPEKPKKIERKNLTKKKNYSTKKKSYMSF